MAAGMLPEPGSEYGPCKKECQHTDCALTRKMAATVCTYCSKEIGYGRLFYDLGDDKLVHYLCHEEAR